MNALILVDIQNDFLPGGALAVPAGNEIVPILNRLQHCFDFVVATQDWHPADHGSFAANHHGRKIGDVIELTGLAQVLWPAHCVQETAGADFAPGLNQTRWDRVFQKGADLTVDSYSGFFDNGHRNATGLGDWLRAQNVTQLYVAGLATDYCVKFTVLDALQLGFETTLIEDACRGIELQPGDISRAIEEMRAAGADVCNSTDVTRQAIRPPFERSYWVEPGRLLAGYYPGDVSPADRDTKLKGLLDCGVTRIINLMEANESDRSGKPFEAYEARFLELARERGIAAKCTRLPIKDLSVPDSDGMNAILETLADALAKDETVYVHCLGGRGRTGTVIGCHLRRSQNLSGMDALSLLSNLTKNQREKFRSGPENPRQRSFVVEWKPLQGSGNV